MIDTSKYEGHTPAPWEVRTYYDTTCVCYSKDDNSECSFVKIHEEHENEQDVQLMADAPLLLAEVKRLREQLKKEIDTVKNYVDYSKDLQREIRRFRKEIRELEDDGE